MTRPRRVRELIKDKREAVLLSRRKEYREAAKFDHAAKMARAFGELRPQDPQLRKGLK